MFTGLIQALGRLYALEPRGGDLRLRVAVDAAFLDGVREGDSIAVSGVCLTALEIDGAGFSADVSTETLGCTTLSGLMPGAGLNLERSLTLATPLGGHFVSGHVDGIGLVRAITADARSQRWLFDVPAELRRYIARKGSIAVEGVSLTVNEVDEDGFGVMLIPHTLAHTNLGRVCAGARVNLEIDLIARDVERLLEARGT